MLKLRPIAELDLEWARKLRNANRQYFFSSGLITKENMQKWFRERFQKPAEEKETFYIIIYENERVGTISVFDRGNVALIGNILIDSKYRNKGIMRKCFGILKKQHQKPFRLEVKVDNKVAIQAYERIGFKTFALMMRMENSCN